MKFSVGLCLFLGAVLATVIAQRGNFRQFNNNNFQNNNFRPNNNNFRPQQQNFRPQQQNFRQFNNNNNNFQPQRQQPAQQQSNQNFAFGLDTSDGRYAKFNGPVRGLPHGHGGGRYGAADCLLCPNGF